MLTSLKTKLSFTVLTVAFFLTSCGDTDPGSTDISGYTLSYSSVAVPRTTAYPFEITPSWNVTPSQVSYTISPSLPDGVSLNPTTGRVTGNSLNISESIITYTVTATGSGAYSGTVTATFTIHALTSLSININSLSLSYDDINVHVNQNVNSSPVWTNHDYPVTANYEVSPPLPPDLSFNTNTGEISGALTSPMSISNYTVTAIGVGVYTGSNVTSFNLTVADVGKTFLDTLALSYSNIGVSYSNGVEVYTINISNIPNPIIPTLSPQWSVTPTATYTVEPPLPPWLNFNTNTGVIITNGIPTPYYRRHTITASADEQHSYIGTTSTTTIIAISVNADNNNIQSLIDAQISDQGNQANLNIIDTSGVTDMSSLFQNKINFNGDISDWDVSEVTDMNNMLGYAIAFSGDISDWDVGNVTNMYGMFANANLFNSDISGWDVGNVVNMYGMLESTFSFNRDLNDWDVSKVTDMERMFFLALSFNGDISGWDVSKVNNMNKMFEGARSFNGDVSGWNISGATTMLNMFAETPSFTGDLEVWNVSNHVNTSSMFEFSAANLPIWYRSITYPPIRYLQTNGYDIGTHTPTWDISPTGDHRRSVTYSINPDISEIGLNFNNNTGEISGAIPNINLGALTSNYTVTAKPSVAGDYIGTSYNFTLVPSRVDVSTLGLSYDDFLTLTNQTTNSIPIWSGTNEPYPLTANYQVSPALPSGLSLNTNTGEIDGTPSSELVATDYTITATGYGLYTGSKTTSVTITVAEARDVFLNDYTLTYSNIGISYSNGIEIYTLNISNTPNPTISISPQWSGGSQTPTNTIYSVEPALPSWLGINSNTGVISNTMTPTPYYLKRTITATGQGGYAGRATATVTIAIAVNAADRGHLVNLINDQIAIQGNKANLNIIDTSRVTDMSRVFRNSSFNGDISRWDVSKVTSMVGMFEYARSFNGDISHWDVSKVTSMSLMFSDASSFNGDLSLWDVSRVINIDYMFYNTQSFTGNLESWNLNDSASMSEVFDGSGLANNPPSWYNF